MNFCTDTGSALFDDDALFCFAVNAKLIGGRQSRGINRAGASAVVAAGVHVGPHGS